MVGTVKRRVVSLLGDTRMNIDECGYPITTKLRCKRKSCQYIHIHFSGRLVIRCEKHLLDEHDGLSIFELTREEALVHSVMTE